MLFIGLSFVLVRLESIVRRENPSRVLRLTRAIQTFPVRKPFNVPSDRVGKSARVAPWFVCVLDLRDIVYFMDPKEARPYFHLIGRLRNPGGAIRLDIQAPYSYLSRAMAFLLFAFAVILAMFLSDGIVAASVVFLPCLAFVWWARRSYVRAVEAIVEGAEPVLEAMSRANLERATGPST